MTLKNSGPRFLSLVLAGVLLFHCGFAHASERGFWAERRETARRMRSGEGLADRSSTGGGALLSQAMATSLSTSALFKTPLSFSLDPKEELKKSQDTTTALAKLLVGPAVIQSRRDAGEKAPLVVLIQDVHGLLPAQINITEILSLLYKSHPEMPLVLEGGAGEIDLASWRDKDSTINRQTAAFYFNAGLISGGEYSALADGEKSVVLGAENPKLYLANVNALRLASSKTKEIQGLIVDWNGRLEKLKKRHYPPDLIRLDREEKKWSSPTGSLTEKLDTLSRHPLAPSLKEFPRINKFLETLVLERSLNVSLATSQRTEFLKKLGDSLSVSALDPLVQSAVDLRTGRITPGEFYAFLEKTASRHHVLLSEYPAFATYVRYVLGADAIEPLLLQEEIDLFEKSLWTKLLKTEEERTLYALSKDFFLIEKLAGLSFTPSDWAAWLERRDLLRRWPERLTQMDGGPRNDKNNVFVLAPFEKFYALAEARNAAMAQCVIPYAQKHSVTALVVGGYHERGLAPLLVKAGVSVLTVSPRLSSVDGAPSAFDLFTRERTPLEYLFTSPRIGLSKTLGIAPLGNTDSSRNTAMKALSRLVPQALRGLRESKDGAFSTQESQDDRVVQVTASRQAEVPSEETRGTPVLQAVPASLSAGSSNVFVTVYRVPLTVFNRIKRFVPSLARGLSRLVMGMSLVFVLNLSFSDTPHAAVAPAVGGVGSTLSVSSNSTAVVKADGLRLRNGPTTDATILGTLGKGGRVSILGTTTDASGNQWFQIVDSKGSKGWVSQTGLTLTTTDAVVKADGLRLRNGPTTDATILGTLGKGGSVSILETTTDGSGNQWFQIVDSNGRPGWVSQTGLTLPTSTVSASPQASGTVASVSPVPSISKTDAVVNVVSKASPTPVAPSSLTGVVLTLGSFLLSVVLLAAPLGQRAGRFLKGEASRGFFSIAPLTVLRKIKRFVPSVARFLSRLVTGMCLVFVLNLSFSDTPQAAVAPAVGGVGSTLSVPSNTTAVVKVAGLRLRNGPTTDAPVLGILTKSGSVSILGTTTDASGNQWFQIVDSNGRLGWVSQTGLTFPTSTVSASPKAGGTGASVSPVPSSSRTDAVVNVDALKVRNRPKPGAPVLGLLPRGTVVSVDATNGFWSRISYNKKPAWVSSSMLTTVAPVVPKASPTPVAPSSLTGVVLTLGSLLLSVVLLAAPLGQRVGRFLKGETGRGFFSIRRAPPVVSQETKEAPLRGSWSHRFSYIAQGLYVPLGLLVLIYLLGPFFDLGNWLSSYLIPTFVSATDYPTTNWLLMKIANFIHLMSKSFALFLTFVAFSFFALYLGDDNEMKSVNGHKSEPLVAVWSNRLEKIQREDIGGVSLDDFRAMDNDLQTILLNHRVTPETLKKREVVDSLISLYRSLTFACENSIKLIERRLESENDANARLLLLSLRERMALAYVFSLKGSQTLLPASTLHWALGHYANLTYGFERWGVFWLLRKVRRVDHFFNKSNRSFMRMLAGPDGPEQHTGDVSGLSLVSLGNRLVPGLFPESDVENSKNTFNALLNERRGKVIDDGAGKKDLKRKGISTIVSLLSLILTSISALLLSGNIDATVLAAIAGSFLLGLGLTMSMFHVFGNITLKDKFSSERAEVLQGFISLLNPSSKEEGLFPNVVSAHLSETLGALNEVVSSGPAGVDQVILVAQSEKEEAFYRERAEDPHCFPSGMAVVVLRAEGGYDAYSKAWAWLQQNQGLFPGKNLSDLHVAVLVSRTGESRELSSRKLKDLPSFSSRFDPDLLGETTVFSLQLANAYRALRSTDPQTGAFCLRYADQPRVGPASVPNERGFTLDADWSSLDEMDQRKLGVVSFRRPNPEESRPERPFRLVRGTTMDGTFDSLRLFTYSRGYDRTNRRLAQVETFSGEMVVSLDEKSLQAHLDLLSQIEEQKKTAERDPSQNPSGATGVVRDLLAFPVAVGRSISALFGWGGRETAPALPSAQPIPSLSLVNFLLIPMSLRMDDSLKADKDESVTGYFNRFGYLNSELPVNVQLFNLQSKGLLANHPGSAIPFHVNMASSQELVTDTSAALAAAIPEEVPLRRGFLRIKIFSVTAILGSLSIVFVSLGALASDQMQRTAVLLGDPTVAVHLINSTSFGVGLLAFLVLSAVGVAVWVLGRYSASPVASGDVSLPNEVITQNAWASPREKTMRSFIGLKKVVLRAKLKREDNSDQAKAAERELASLLVSLIEGFPIEGDRLEGFAPLGKRTPQEVLEGPASHILGAVAEKSLAHQLLQWRHTRTSFFTKNKDQKAQNEILQAAFLAGLSHRMDEEKALNLFSNLSRALGCPVPEGVSQRYKAGLARRSALISEMMSLSSAPLVENSFNAYVVSSLFDSSGTDTVEAHREIVRQQIRLRAAFASKREEGEVVQDVLVVHSSLFKEHRHIQKRTEEDIRRGLKEECPGFDKYFDSVALVVVEDSHFAPETVQGLVEKTYPERFSSLRMNLFTPDIGSLLLDPTKTDGSYRVWLMKLVSGEIKNLDVMAMVQQAFESAKVIRSKA